MRILELRLQNYRRFRAAALEFPDGLIGVVGRNGAGKSSLLESILWCLFGHDVLRTAKDLVKHQAAAAGEDVEARLVFELDGTAYEVVRRLRGRAQTPEASVASGGQALVAAGPNSWDQANRFLERLLGFDRIAFESTVIAKQGELAALSDLRPANRKKLLLGMLGVERIESAIAACRGEARLLEARVAEGRRSLEALPRLSAERDAFTAELSTASQTLARLDAEMGPLSSKAAASRRAADEQLALRLRDQELRIRLQGLQGRLESAWQQRSRLAAERLLLQERQAAAQRLRARLDALGDLDAERDALERSRRDAERRAEIERRIRKLRGAAAELGPSAAPIDLNGDAPEHLRAEMKRLQGVLEDSFRAASEHRAQQDVADSQLRRLTSSTLEAGPADPCPVCRRPFGESLGHLREELEAERRILAGRLDGSRKGLQEAEAERAGAQQALLTVQARLRDSELRLARVEAASRELGRIQGELSAVEEEALRLPSPVPVDEAALSARLRERDGLRLDLARAEEAALRIARLSEEDRVLRAQEAEIQAAREVATRELQQVAYGPGAWEAAHAEAEHAARRLEAVQRDLIQWRERVDARRRECTRIEEQLAVLGTRKAELDAQAAELAVLDALAGPRGDVGLLCEFKTHVIGRIRPSLARTTSELLRVMTRGRYSELSLDDEYGGHLYDGATAHPLVRFSGGEVDVANLALRLAVSELVANARGRSRLQFVALDEVFGSQDEERRQSVVDALHSLSSVFRQILVVTHLEDVRERLEHILRVEDVGDGTSRLVASWQDKA